jgi:hypothetical protein
MVYVQIQDRAVTPVHVHRGSQAQCVRWRWMIVKTYPVSMEDLVRYSIFCNDYQFIEQKTILKVQLFNAKKVSNLLAIIFGFVVWIQ